MPIDGLVHISAIPGDYWELDAGGMGLVGQRTGRRWQMGDALRVRLNRVDLMQRQIDFEIADQPSSTASGSVWPRRGQAAQHAGRNSGGSGRQREAGQGGRGARRGGRGGRGGRG